MVQADQTTTSVSVQEGPRDGSEKHITAPTIEDVH
jgi:hypothetical protein